MTQPILVEGQPHVTSQMHVSQYSDLGKVKVIDLEERFHLSVVMLCKDGQRQFHPAGCEATLPAETVAIFGTPEQIDLVLHENKC